MTNGLTITSASLSLLAGSTALARLALPTARVCQIPHNITFPSERSFVESTADNKLAFQELITRLNIGGAQNLLLITGHTDSGGSSSLNQALSERRAQAVRAVLRGDTAAWETLFNHPDEGWSTPELTMMAAEVGEADLNRFRGPANAANRADLFRRYFASLLGGRAVPAISTTTPDLLACGKDQLLHGSRVSPSRNTSLPPIMGEFRPNRRSEFFFFSPPQSTISCPEYPRWVGLCSLIPPVVNVTVTIAPVETVRRNENVDIQITVTPPAATPTINLTLSTTAGTGEARFTANNSNATTIRGSAVVTVRGITVSSQFDNIRLTANVVGQAAATVQEDFTVVDTIFIHLQFEVWNVGARAFQTLPAGVNVELMDQTSQGGITINSQATNASGRVVFNLPDLSASGRANPDIFFLVHTNGRAHAGHTLPSQWSTSGWLAADNTTPGLQPAFAGPALGTPSAPVVFRVGLDVHFRILYHVDAGTRSGNDDPSPAQVLVKLMQEITGPDLELLSLRTNSDGEIHAVSFTASPGNSFYLHIDFEMEDGGINLRRTRITDSAFLTLTWDTNDADADRKDFRSHNRTSIGTQTAPELPTATINRRNIALYQLKVIRELAVFLFEITNHTWPGLELRVFPHAPSAAFSWPPGQVNIPETAQWRRSTIIHETSHQVMWLASNFTTGDITGQFIAGLAGFAFLHGCHQPPFLSNERHALIEGWAQFMASVFEGTGTPPFTITDVENCTSTIVSAPGTTLGFRIACVCTSLGVPLGPGGGAPTNQGQQVEGAFANGLWGVFEHQVVGSASASAHVPEAAKEQVTTDAPWVRTPALRTRFLNMIFVPLVALRGATAIGSKTTGRMIAFMESNNPSTWHLLQPELQAFNMAMTAPTLSGITPNGGSPGGGTRVVITGTDFTSGTTTVTIGGNPVGGPNVSVTDSTTLEADTPPGTLGPADVTVSTPAGTSAPLVGGFLYARAPVITDLFPTGSSSGTPARGPTTGGTSVTIIGTDFHPNARIFFGGLPPTGVEATPGTTATPTQIDVLTPLFPLPANRPGATDVVVQNPDTQTGRRAAAFEYFLGPAPSISLVDPPSGQATVDTEITIRGSNFILNNIQVFVDGQQQSIDLGRSNSTEIVTFAQALPAATALPHDADIRVVNLDGQEALVRGGFRYTP